MSKKTRFPYFLDVETKDVDLDEISTTVRFSDGLVFIEPFEKWHSLFSILAQAKI